MRRVREHKTGIGSEFTTKYKLDRLVYFERFEDVHNAIEREKTIKSWLRIKKIGLVVSVNPSWKDLREEWSSVISTSRVVLNAFTPTQSPLSAPPKPPLAAGSTA